MNPEIIFQVIVGLGMIGGMWRLTREVAALTATMSHLVGEQKSHEGRLNHHSERIRKLEVEVARGQA